jgi:hypothetical protein
MNGRASSHSLVIEYSPHSWPQRRVGVMQEDDEYVAGLAGSEQSPTTKKKTGSQRLKKRAPAPCESPPAVAPPPAKKSQARQMQEIAAGASVGHRQKRDGVKDVVQNEKRDEER